MKTLTNSATAVAGRCLQEYYFRYVLCRRSKATREMDIGSIWGLALDQWFFAFQHAVQVVALATAIACIDEHTDDPYTAAMLRALIAGYHYRWAPAMDHLTVRSIEPEFDLPLDNPDGGRSRTFRRGGKLDKVLVDTVANELVVMEHKTTASDIAADKPYMLRLALDPQITEYLDALGGQSVTCLYDVVHKPQQRPLKKTQVLQMTKGKQCKACPGSDCEACTGTGWKEAPRLRKGQRLTDETPEEFEARLLEAIADNPNKYYQRAQITRDHEQLTEHRRSLWATSVRLREAHRTNSWPRNTHACMRHQRLCSYFPVCSGTCSIDDSRFHTTETHPELHGNRSTQTAIGFDEAETEESQASTALVCPRPPRSRQDQLGARGPGESAALRLE